MVSATDGTDIVVPVGFESAFTESPEPGLSPADLFQMSVADDVLRSMVDDLRTRAEDVIAQSGVTRPSTTEIEYVYACYRHGVPAIEPSKPAKDAPRMLSLPNILNAAWMAHHDDKIWQDNDGARKNKDVILNELVLKNIEILEIELIMEDHA